MRTEHDCIGEMEIEDYLYYGIQTKRGVENFAVSGQTYESYPLYLTALAYIKKAAAIANAETGAIPKRVSNAVCQAADEVIAGKLKGMFPVDVFCGSVSVHMNMNEVLANRANEILTGHKGSELVHPNTHVNCGQSTNDVVPSAIALSCYMYFDGLIAVLEELSETLERKAAAFSDVVKVARTCLQDAVPITLGQEFSGYHALIERQLCCCRSMQADCASLCLGATAVGTGMGTLPGYKEAVYRHLAEISGVPVRCKENLMDGLQNDDGFLAVSGTLKNVAVALNKIARDVRLMSSGPRAGLQEISLPALQPGSSIMPGKINPAMPELIIHLGYQICGNDQAITMAVEGGELDLNVWDAPLRKCLQESFVLLINSIPRFTNLCIKGITANKEVCRRYAEESLSNATVLSAIYGYETGTKVAKEAYAKNASIRKVAVEQKLFTPEQAREMLDPMLLTKPEECSRRIEWFKHMYLKKC